MKRSDLLDAPYNPRSITDKARKKLKENIKRVGFMGGVVYNKRTGHLVSGHQRLNILDSLERSSDYELDVSVVDLDEKTEKEQNLFFNNQETQGDWDWSKLEKMFKDDGINNDFAGFDLGDIYQMFGGNPEIAENNSTINDNIKNKIAEMKADIYARQDKGYKVDWNNPNFYLVFVFKDAPAREKLTQLMELDNVVWQDGQRLTEAIEEVYELAEEGAKDSADE
jgi:hypothetical protein